MTMQGMIRLKIEARTKRATMKMLKRMKRKRTPRTPRKRTRVKQESAWARPAGDESMMAAWFDCAAMLKRACCC
jgi:hypothetical protein